MLDELDSYTLSDFLLFSRETYVRLFELYNEALWPLHVFALACGGAVLYFLLRGNDRAAWGLLALSWAWVGWAFHLERYATINLAGPYFAALFGLEAVLLLLMAAFGRPRHQSSASPGNATAEFRDRHSAVGMPADASGARSSPPAASLYAGATGTQNRPHTADGRRVGAAIVSYAILVHPLTEVLAGRTWTELSFFGLAPDPTAIGTLGALLFIRGRFRWALLLPAVAWCVVSALTAYSMGSAEAVAPAAAAVAGLLLSVRTDS